MEEGGRALVTGAAGGIGRATAERLARNGWRVLAADRDADRLAWTEATGIAGVAADISSEADNARMMAEAEARLGGLDAVILNAAVPGGGGIDDLPFAEFQRVIAVNLFGPVLGIKAALPLLRRSDRPAIAVTSSTMGLGGEAGNWAYCAAKHGIIGLVRSLARELGGEGIRINALCPGPTETPMAGASNGVRPPFYAHLAARVPLGRWADPGEMASVLEFLVSPASSYVNGHALVADGGALVGTGLTDPKAAPR